MKMPKKPATLKQKSPKTQKLLAKWILCPFCRLKFLNLEEDEHREHCTADCPLPDDVSSSLGLLVDSNTLVARVWAGSGRIGISDSNDDWIYLNPKTMCELRINNGFPAILNNQFVGYVRFSESVHLASVEIGKKFLEKIHEKFQTEYIVLQPIRRPFVPASEIRVSLINEDQRFLDRYFLKSLLPLLVRKFVSVGTELMILHKGRSYQLRVDSIVFGNGETVKELACESNSKTCESNSKTCESNSKTCESNSKTRESNNCTSLNKDFRIWERKRFFQVVREMKRPVEALDEQNSSSVCIVKNTEVMWAAEKTQITRRLDSFAGYKKQKKEIFKFLSTTDEERPLGLLVHGLHGVGKSKLVEAISCSSSIPIRKIDLSDIMLCPSERGVIQVVSKAALHPPCVIVIESLDVLCSSYKPLPKGSDWKYKDAIIMAMEQMRKRKNVYFIGIARNVSDIHRDILVSSRFGIHVQMGIPSIQERVDIFKKCLDDKPCVLLPSVLKKVAEDAHCFVGNDLVMVSDMALNEAALRQKKKCEGEDEIPVIGAQDVMLAVNIQKAILMNDLAYAINPVSWDDIGGQKDLKIFLKSFIEDVVTSAYSTEQSRGSGRGRGVLLYGPPGCSKTMIAKAIATHCSTSFFPIKGPELISKYVGESERNIRQLFAKARQAAPSVIFFDEIDAIGESRGNESKVTDTMVTTLMSEMEYLNDVGGVAVIGATNLPNRVDTSLLASHRFRIRYYVRLPDADTRREIIQLQFRRRPIAADVDVDELIQKTEGFSGAELVGLFHKAATRAMIKDRSATEITYDDLTSVLNDIKPAATPELLEMYEEFQRDASARKKQLRHMFN